METQVVLDTNGMTLRAQSGDPDVAIFGTTTKFFDGVGDADANRKLQLNADGVFVFGTNTNTFAHLGSHGLTIASGSVDVALFSETTRIGALNQGHITASSDGLTIMDSATKVGRFGAGGAIIGDETKTHISASTTELNILQGGLVSASFGLVTTIGSTIGNHVQVDSDGVSIKSGNVTFLSASSAGLEMSGSIKASSGEVGGFLITKNSLTSNEDFNDVDAGESGVYVGNDGIAIDDTILLRANGEATASKFKFDGGSVGAFELRPSDVNPYVADLDTALIAATDTFNTCSIVASTAPYMEFSSGDTTGKTVWSHTANGGKTIQKFVYTPADESLFPYKGFFNETAPSEINAAYIKHIASSAVGGVMTEYTNNEIGGGALAVGQRMIMYAASGSTDNASGINRGATNLGTKTYGVGQAYQIANSAGNEWTTQITIGQIGMNVDRHRVTYDWHTNSSKPSLANGILLEGTSTTQGPAKLVLMDDAHAVFSSGSANTPALSFNSYDDGFFHDSNGLNLMVNNAHDFLFKDGGEFHADNDVIAFSSTISDERLKDEVKTIEFALDKINNLRGVEYVWNRGGREGEKDLGVIAQEVEKVIPEIVRDKEMPLMDDSGETYKTVDYEKLTAVLIEGVKEQQKQIDELRKELREMKDGSTS